MTLAAPPSEDAMPTLRLVVYVLFVAALTLGSAAGFLYLTAMS